MRRFLAAALVTGAMAAGATGSALAQARPDSLTMTCAQLRAYMASRGAAVIGTGPHIYDRYVIDQRFCPNFDGTKPAWIATRDTRQCMVGFTCIPVQDMWPMSDF